MTHDDPSGTGPAPAAEDGGPTGLLDLWAEAGSTDLAAAGCCTGTLSSLTTYGSATSTASSLTSTATFGCSC